MLCDRVWHVRSCSSLTCSCKLYCFYSAPDSGAEYCDERVCLCMCVCLWNYISDAHQTSVHVTYGRGSVLQWRHSDMLCPSSFMDDVMFAHKPRMLHVATQLKRSAHAAWL